MNKTCVIMMGGCINTVNTLRAQLSVDEYYCISIDECISKSKNKMFDESFVLSRDEIQPVGGFKSYRKAKSLLENIYPALLDKLNTFSSITIIGLSVCLVGNCIDYLIEGLQKTTNIDIYLITPFSFEGINRLTMSDDLMGRIKSKKDNYFNFILHIYDGRKYYGFNTRSIPLIDLLNLVSNDIYKQISS